jgi:anti-sigma regulatory factor (Ser/Thr protein kinase)
VSIVRAVIRQALGVWGVGDRAEEVVLCISELATNAVQHGAFTGSPLRIRASVAGEFLRVEVEDTSRARPRMRHPGDEDTHGRGLLLVAALADDWGFDEGAAGPCAPGGKTVWAEFKAGTRFHAP